MLEIFKALSEESRLRILSLLVGGEMCVCEIEASLKLTQSNASRQLSILKRSGILESYKQAQWTYYRINPKFMKEYNEIWNYLCNHIKELPSYEKDAKSLKECSKQDICGCCNKPH